MATINFYLDKPDNKGKSHIFLVFQMSGKKFKTSTHEKVDAKYWNTKKQRVKSISEADDINEVLDKLEGRLNRTFRELKREEENFDIQDIKYRFLEKPAKKKPQKKMGLFEFFEHFLEKKKASKKRTTLKEYNTIVNDLKEYEVYYKEKLTFDKIDEDFFNQFLDFLYEEKGNVRATVAKKISTLKTMLRTASRIRIGDSNQKLNTNMDFLDFVVKDIPKKKVTLTEDELLKLYHFDLSENKRLERIRDKFCFVCLTGMRFSDLNELKMEWITQSSNKEKAHFLEYKDQKTNTDISIPLATLALRIIDKYQTDKASHNPNREGTLIFSKITPQKYNEYLKELGQLVGLDQAVSIKKYYSNIEEPKEIIYKKYELLSSHAARRTYISISMMRGAEPIAVQEIVGHKKLQTTMKYTTIKEDWKVKQMRDAWDGFGE